MSLLEYLHEWHEPIDVKKQTARYIEAKNKAVLFAFTAAEQAEIEKAYRIAAMLALAYDGEPVEMCLLLGQANLRFNEGMAIEIITTMPVDNFELSDKCLLIWCDNSEDLANPPDAEKIFACWAGNDKTVRKIK